MVFSFPTLFLILSINLLTSKGLLSMLLFLLCVDDYKVLHGFFFLPHAPTPRVKDGRRIRNPYRGSLRNDLDPCKPPARAAEFFFCFNIFFLSLLGFLKAPRCTAGMLIKRGCHVICSSCLPLIRDLVGRQSRWKGGWGGLFVTIGILTFPRGFSSSFLSPLPPFFF